MKKRRFTAFLLTAFALFGLFSIFAGLPASALKTPSMTWSDAAILYHNESGTVVYRNENRVVLQTGPGVRLMAALVLSEVYGEDVARTVTVNKRVTGLALSTLNPGLKSGEQLPAYDLFCAALIANSNDALFALAFDVYGDAADSPAQLIAAMNGKAKTLGMEHTVFYDLTGADRAEGEETPPSTTSIDDLLTLAIAVQKNAMLKEICAMPEYSIPETEKSPKRTILTRNYMLSAKRIPGYTYSYARGLAAQNGKTSGWSAIETADYGGKSFICIVIGSDEEYGAFKDAKELFAWANKNFTYKTVLEKTRILGEIKVALSGDTDYVTVAPKESVAAFLPNDTVVSEEIEVKTHLSFSELTAPVHEGLIAGTATVLYNGRELAQVDLVTTGSLLLSNSRYYLALFLHFVTSPAFIWTCVGVVLLLVVYVLLNARMRYLRKKSPSLLTMEFDDGRDTPYVASPGGAGSLSAPQPLDGKEGAEGEKAAKDARDKSGKPPKTGAVKVKAQKEDAPAALAEKNEDAGHGKKSGGKSGDGGEDESAVHIRRKSTEEEIAAAKKAEENLKKRGRGDYVPEGWGKSDKDD